jgi:N-dimethylarginine dimethylaminohydrolase
MAVLMCRPDHFGIEYAINPWMDVDVQADTKLAAEQWQRLYDTYNDLGQTVELMDPVKGLPDMVFTANAGIVWGKKFVRSNFHDKERQGEEPYYEQRMADLGYEVHTIDRAISYEGAGDGLFLGETLFFGSGFRTDKASHALVGEILDVEVVSLDLVDPRFYHLDTCFCPLNGKTVLFAPQAFTEESAAIIRRRVAHVVEVPLETAQGFACNAIAIGDRVVSSVAATELRDPLHEAGYDTVGLPMSEFMKSGGGVRCLTLPLNVGPAS